MQAAINIGSLTCISMIACVLFKPQVKIKRFFIDTYWVIAVIGAIALLVFGSIDIKEVLAGLTADTAINPLKILILFISMTLLSIFLDEAGFFKYLANVTLKKAKSDQFLLFMYLYIIVSVLTVFTSNDIIVLTFTPFICYFAKNAKISPIPYLVTEFVAANTWSLMLIIGNPTNIYLATSYNINFVDYAAVMILPTIGAGIAAFLALWLIFRKQLKVKIDPDIQDVKIEDKVTLVIGIVHLALCTVLLAVSSYIDMDMWRISLIFAVSLFVCVTIANLVRHKKLKILWDCTERAPWQLIPFVISMFIVILALSKYGVTAKVASFFGEGNTVFKYGLSSFLSANIINNIPMSVLYSSIMETLQGLTLKRAVYATIIGSNIGAFLSPIGALAGIMWTSILKKHDIKYGFLDFTKYGILISIPTILVSLLILNIVIR
jgi:arsenical pump membrane protein